MTSYHAPQDLQLAWDTLRSLLAEQKFEQAGQLLLAHAEQLLEYNGWRALNAVLPLFPAHLFDEDPDFRYVEGLVYAKAGLHQEAINLLERARFSYTTNQAYTKAAQCGLELVRLYLGRDNFRTAYYYLNEEIEPLIERGLVTDPLVRARFFLRMAELCPDIGKLRVSVEYAHQAFATYKAIGDLPGQFYALVRLAGTANHLGNYAEAASKLELAWSCYNTGNLGANARSRLLNIMIHQQWYQGKLEDALALAANYLTLVDEEQFSNFRIYARMLLGNLYRSNHEFEQAEQWYEETRRLITELNYHFYTPWVDMQMAWLRALEGRIDEARSLIHASLKTSDLGQAISFQVLLALINLLDNSIAVAARLLQESLAYYMASGDLLSCCALRFYLALVCLRNGQAEAAQAYLHEALGWLAQQHLDGFPHWWYPPFVSELCAYTLQVDIFPEVAERIFVNRLKEAGVSALRALLYAENPAGRNYARRLLFLIEGNSFDELVDLEDETSRKILEELLYQGKLRREGLAQLRQRLMTAQQRKTPNPTLLSIFALYVNGYTRAEIANRLDCSVATVRNYINLLYHIFDLPSEDFEHRRDRQRQLAECARELGYV